MEPHFTLSPLIERSGKYFLSGVSVSSKLINLSKLTSYEIQKSAVFVVFHVFKMFSES